MFPFLKYKKYYFLLSSILVFSSIFFLFYFGLNLGIDFAGGSVLRVEYKEERPPIEEVSSKIAKVGLTQFSFREMGQNGLIIKTKDIDPETRAELVGIFLADPNVDKDKISFEKVGAVVGEETKKKAIWATILSILAIILYVSFAFKQVSRPIKSFEYGIATIIALLHDVLISLGLVSLLGKLYLTEFSIPILTALLTIFGYSVNDTVVVFDRIRENLRKTGKNFEEVVDISLNQALTRSVSTSLTTLFVLVAVFLFGGEDLKDFSLVLIAGIASGTYSSIFLASPLLVFWYKRKRK
ncbi:MAG: protein translocase subunit SecF [Candidatus Pacebacteria bacterium]|nr:protein translocase subunit SecF [Candidatus Paceibacterota bacterium]